MVAPITRPGGVLVLLALLKWKRADARLLLALACVPHTTVPYETIPLFLIPQTWRQAWALWALALLAYVAQWWTGPYGSQMAYWTSGAQWIVALIGNGDPAEDFEQALGLMIFCPDYRPLRERRKPASSFFPSH